MLGEDRGDLGAACDQVRFGLGDRRAGAQRRSGRARGHRGGDAVGRVDDDDRAASVVADPVWHVAQQELLAPGHAGVADDQDVDPRLLGRADDRHRRVGVDDDVRAAAVAGEAPGLDQQRLRCRGGPGALGVAELGVDRVARHDHLDQMELRTESFREVRRPPHGSGRGLGEIRADHDARDRPVEGARCVHARIMPWMACRGKGGVPVRTRWCQHDGRRRAGDAGVPNAERALRRGSRRRRRSATIAPASMGCPSRMPNRSATTAARISAPMPVTGARSMISIPVAPAARAQPAPARPSTSRPATVATRRRPGTSGSAGPSVDDLDRGGVRHRGHDGGGRRLRRGSPRRPRTLGGVCAPPLRVDPQRERLGIRGVRPREPHEHVTDAPRRHLRTDHVGGAEHRGHRARPSRRQIDDHRRARAVAVRARAGLPGGGRGGGVERSRRAQPRDGRARRQDRAHRDHHGEAGPRQARPDRLEPEGGQDRKAEAERDHTVRRERLTHDPDDHPEDQHDAPGDQEAAQRAASTDQADAPSRGARPTARTRPPSARAARGRAAAADPPAPPASGRCRGRCRRRTSDRRRAQGPTPRPVSPTPPAATPMSVIASRRSWAIHANDAPTPMIATAATRKSGWASPAAPINATPQSAPRRRSGAERAGQPRQEQGRERRVGEMPGGEIGGEDAREQRRHRR